MCECRDSRDLACAPAANVEGLDSVFAAPCNKAGWARYSQHLIMQFVGGQDNPGKSTACVAGCIV